MISRTMIVLIALAVSYGGLGLYAFYEHEHLIAANGLVARETVEIGKWQSATMDQNEKLQALQEREAQAESLAADALKKAQESNAQAAAEHKRLQALINQPTDQKSCDAAWDEIEKGV